MIVVRWNDPDPQHVSLLKEAGITAVLPAPRNQAFASACSQAGIQVLPEGQIRFLKLSEIDQAPSGQAVALTEGLWPGVRSGPNVKGRGDEVASASREPWVDANGYWIGCLRALYPQREAMLGYLPNQAAGVTPERLIPFSTLELALAEAWMAGGNYVLALETRYRELLLKGDAEALTAWRRLGETAQWLERNAALFRQPALEIVTALVEPGPQTCEIANLLYRRNASPSLARVDAPGPPSPKRLALVAANIRPPQPEVRSAILRHAETGSIVIAAGRPTEAWWREERLKPLRSESDRDFYTLGSGQVIAYKRPIADPSEFALDVIDVVTHKLRPARLWNAPAVIALATAPPGKREACLHLINYGTPVDREFPARIQGRFDSAELLRPGRQPLKVQSAKRGSTTEVVIPEIDRVGVVVFS